MSRRFVPAIALAMVACAAHAQIVSDRVEGTRTFDIGPGQPHTFDTVPFDSLLPGDVVNIHFQETPYKYKFGLKARGTAENPVIINGVTDPDGRKPILDFQSARTAALTAKVFNNQAQYGESLGGIVIKRGQGDDYAGPKPSYIQLQHLEVRNAKGSYTGLGNVSRRYGGSPACIYVLASSHLLIDNLDVTGCAFGLFVMAKDGLMSQNSDNITIRRSKFYKNGKVNSWFEHGVYLQAAGALVEDNYFGDLIDGALGSSFKDRSAALIFRRNFIVSHARATDFVQSEGQDIDGIPFFPGYGTDYVYDNTYVIDSETAIHYGGDNMGEQESGDELFIPPTPYREHLYFYNNTVTYTICSWRNMIFDISTRDTVVEAWNNTFNLSACTENHHLVEWAGTVLLGPNTFNGPIQFNGRDFSNPAMIRIITDHAPPF
jgi:hypothetical protein